VYSGVWSAGLIVFLAWSAFAAGEDKEAVEAVPRQFVSAWNRHEMDALAGLFAPDADFVNVIGQHWIGREAIKKAHAENHATIFRRSQLNIREISIRFLKPDVAVVRFVTKLTGEIDQKGQTLPVRYSIPTFVMARIENKWLIVVAQNTDIDTDISPIKP
jgi:uncharacterized protein (TIGR02246 family)